MNLENLGVQELNLTEVNQTDGGWKTYGTGSLVLSFIVAAAIVYDIKETIKGYKAYPM